MFEITYKESPESYETSGLTGGEPATRKRVIGLKRELVESLKINNGLLPASVCVEAVKMERKKGEQVASKRHLPCICICISICICIFHLSFSWTA